MLASLAVPAVAVLAVICYWKRGLNKTFKKGFRKLRDFFFWSGPLRYWIESYVSICLACVSWLSLPREWSTSGDISINLFCIGSILLYFSSPFLVTRFLRRNFDRFQDPEFRRLFGELTLKLNYHTFSSTNFYAIFCLRRLLLTIFIVLLTKTPSLQIMF